MKQVQPVPDQKVTGSKEKSLPLKQKQLEIVGVDKASKTKTVMQNAYGTAGASPESKLQNGIVDSSKATKSLSNNSRGKYQT